MRRDGAGEAATPEVLRAGREGDGADRERGDGRTLAAGQGRQARLT